MNNTNTNTNTSQQKKENEKKDEKQIHTNHIQETIYTGTKHPKQKHEKTEFSINPITPSPLVR